MCEIILYTESILFFVVAWQLYYLRKDYVKLLFDANQQLEQHELDRARYTARMMELVEIKAKIHTLHAAVLGKAFPAKSTTNYPNNHDV
jgi:hypothetical protein